MKLLLDTCVYGKALEELLQAGHDVIWTGSWDRDPGDTEILAIAFSQQRIVITLDKDFGELAVFKNELHSGIIRLVNIPALDQGKFILHILKKHEQELLSGAIVTANRTRIRVRAGNS